MQLIHADSALHLKQMEGNSIDSIVCDPPYGINLLGKDWDKALPSAEIWKECLRVLKPGGYILAFSAARTYHHLAVDMERIGFITHPMLGWIYGTGFPKATNLSKELDKKRSEIAPDDQFRSYLKRAVKDKGYTYAQLERLIGISGMFSHYVGKSQPQFPNPRVWKKMKQLLSLDDRYDEIISANRLKERSGGKRGQAVMLEGVHRNSYEKYIPTTTLGKKWDGYKYGRQCLKPAIEPIYMGQKPFEKPMVENIKQWGVGALNIEGCRVAENEDGKKLYNNDGRYPANVLHDGSASVMNELNHVPFFYCAKPSPKERGGINYHPTVKPIRLMAHLTKLVTPQGGVCLDPFMGSGTTAIAARINGLHFVGVERDKSYYKLAQKRVAIFEHDYGKYLKTNCGCESLLEMVS